MLFDLSSFRSRLPENVSVFASGSNRVAEIRGFSRLGIPVGVSVNHLTETATLTIIHLHQPIFVDSGAFSEVSFERGELHVVAPISDTEWQKRLAIYLRLAESLREKALMVAPDQVGELSHADFFREAVRVAGVPRTPAAPMKKAPTSNTALDQFSARRPSHPPAFTRHRRREPAPPGSSASFGITPLG